MIGESSNLYEIGDKNLKILKKNQILKIVYIGFCDFSDILRDFKLSFVSDDECGLKNLKTS